MRRKKRRKKKGAESPERKVKTKTLLLETSSMKTQYSLEQGIKTEQPQQRNKIKK